MAIIILPTIVHKVNSAWNKNDSILCARTMSSTLVSRNVRTWSRAGGNHRPRLTVVISLRPRSSSWLPASTRYVSPVTSSHGFRILRIYSFQYSHFVLCFCAANFTTNIITSHISELNEFCNEYKNVTPTLSHSRAGQLAPQFLHLRSTISSVSPSLLVFLLLTGFVLLLLSAWPKYWRFLISMDLNKHGSVVAVFPYYVIGVWYFYGHTVEFIIFRV